jgi:hypothetical protein
MWPLISLATLTAVTWSLRHRGRPWYRNAYSQRTIDGWTITHIGHGIVFYGIARTAFFNWPAIDVISLVVIVESLWESVENRNWVIRLFRQGGDQDYWGDSVANSLTDIAACFVGAVFVSLWI